VATTTLDHEGTETARVPVPPLDAGQVRACLAGFVGRIQQVPPMYSALHHQGQRLYDLARQGIEVERKPREVEIHSLELRALEPTLLELDVSCGQGTYVRSLAADLAVRLGTLGHLEALCRTATSGWTLEQAHDWNTIGPESLDRQLLPLEQVLERFRRVDVPASLTKKLANGQCFSPEELGSLGLETATGQTVWLRAQAGTPIVVAQIDRTDPDPLMMTIVRQLRL
jgi:tRNA pseudouridine55 synthase